MSNIDQYRHKWEKRMVVVAIVVAVIAIAIVVSLGVAKIQIPEWLRFIVFGVFLFPFVITVIIHYNFWKETTSAVEINEQQYPELYRIYKEQVSKANFDFMPKLYLKNGNGVLNAFASKSSIKHTSGYVVVYSDIVDTFYDLGNEDTFRFVVSHELGHIRLGHVNIRRSVMKAILKPVLLDNSLSRAQEYSADRFAASITEKGIAARSLAVLYAGKRNYEKVDIERYINNDTSQFSRFWVAVINFNANHAIGIRRLAAAYRMDKEGWKNVHGDML